MPAGKRVSEVFQACGCNQVPLKVTRQDVKAMAAACSQRPGKGSGR